MRLDVLVTDQDIALARLYCRFIKERSFSAKAASNGLSCLDLVCRHNPQLLILDRELPRRDGDGVLACLRADGKSMPVILTTWNTPPNCLESPVVACLRKFFPLQDLLEAVELALNTRVRVLPTSFVTPRPD